MGVSSAADPPSDDRRGAPRRRALLSGKLVYGAAEYSVDCTIRDLTETGARVRLATDVPVHDPVWLIHLNLGTAYRAAVAWRKPSELGLRFDGAVDLNGPVDAALHHVRRIWIDTTGQGRAAAQTQD